MADNILDECATPPPQSVIVPPVPPPAAVQLQFNPENFLDNPDFAMLAAAGHIPGLNGLEPRRGRRGRRPKAEIEAERLAQYHAAQQALLQQQQAFLSAATANAKRMRAGHEERRGEREKVKDREREKEREPVQRSPNRLGPPPAHGRSANSNLAAEMEGVLDLTGKSKASAASPASSRKEGASGEKGSKLSQKVDTLLKKRRQEAEHNAFDPDSRVPVINMRDGSILQGDKAPRQKELADWLMKNPHYVVDTQAFGVPGLGFPDIFTNGVSASKRSGADDFPSSSSREARDTGLHLTGDENVTVINRKTGKKISGRKAPQLKSLAEWLESNADYDIDPTWAAILREQGAPTPAKPEKRGRKSAASSSSGEGLSGSPTPNLFAGNPFGPGFPLGGGLIPGFGSRFPMAFPGLPGFPLSSALMGMLPGMGADGENATSSLKAETSGLSSGKKGDAASTPSSSSSKGRDRERERDNSAAGAGSSSSTRKSKAEKEKAEKEQQQALESMMQSQLPFIFPQAGLFPGFNPLFAQAAAAGFPGFPFPMGPNPLLNGFDLPPEKAASSSAKEKRGGRGAQTGTASPAESSSSSRTHERERSSAAQQRDKGERERHVGRPRGRPPRARDREEEEVRERERSRRRQEMESVPDVEMPEEELAERGAEAE